MSYETLGSTSATNQASTEQPALPAQQAGGRSETAASPSRSSTTAQPSSATIAATPAAFEQGSLSAAALAYATTRGIDRETLALLNAASGTVYFPRRIQRKSEAVFFPYHLDGKRVNYKACAFPEKDFIGEKGGKLCFLNLDRVLAAPPGDVYIVEGEWDLAAMVQAGIALDRVLSVPNGGHEKSDKQREEASDEPSGYGCVIDALKRGLGKHKRFIFCGDNDDTGHDLQQDMTKLLGQAKFYFVDWPEGVKDANAMLQSDGEKALHDLVTEGELPWPVSGLYSLSELPELPLIRPWAVPNMPAWQDKILFTPGTMSVVTGHPGHGKTAVMAQVWFDIADKNDLVVATAAFETRAKPHYRRILRTLHSRRLEMQMSDEEIRYSDRWINDHYLFMVHPDQTPTLGWFLDMAETAVVRRGAKIIQLDPWNRLEPQREPRETETEYIGRCLTAVYRFAQDMNCHVQILAHPSKMDGPRKTMAPELDDIAGSKHWDNRVDQGLVVHRPKLFDDEGRRCTDAHVYHKKVRFDDLGHPCRVSINLNLRTGRFEDGV